MSILSLETFHGEGSVRIALEGELDYSSALILDDELRRAEAKAVPILVLDLSRLRFMDSTGLAIIVSACRRMRRGGRRLILACPTRAAPRTAEGRACTVECDDAAVPDRRLGRRPG